MKELLVEEVKKVRNVKGLDGTINISDAEEAVLCNDENA